MNLITNISEIGIMGCTIDVIPIEKDFENSIYMSASLLFHYTRFGQSTIYWNSNWNHENQVRGWIGYQKPEDAFTMTSDQWEIFLSYCDYYINNSDLCWKEYGF